MSIRYLAFHLTGPVGLRCASCAVPCTYVAPAPGHVPADVPGPDHLLGGGQRRRLGLGAPVGTHHGSASLQPVCNTQRLGAGSAGFRLQAE